VEDPLALHGKGPWNELEALHQGMDVITLGLKMGLNKGRGADQGVCDGSAGGSILDAYLGCSSQAKLAPGPGHHRLGSSHQL
jgi:hypothetical protein